jgi:ABC-2 type transport system permease protein
MTDKSITVYDSAHLASPPIQEARDLYNYRYLVVQFVRRDLVARYKRSTLGVAWTMLNPLGTMIIISIVFSQVFSTRHAYPAYILTGLLAWNFFNQITGDSMVNLISGVTLLQRIFAPPTIFALTAVGNGLVNLFFSIFPLLLVMLALRSPIHLSILFLPIPTLFLAMFSLGLGLFLSTLAVYYRDVMSLYHVVMTAWFYLTPIIYPEELLDPAIRHWLSILNPLYSLINLWRIPLFEGRIPTWSETLLAAFYAFLALTIGWFFFTNKSKEFPYRI